MLKFIVRRLFLLILTMFIVSVSVFLITEAAPGNVARNVLGIHITPEQEASFLAQMGLDKPVYARYMLWVVGSDWQAENKVGLSMKQLVTDRGYIEWWAVDKDGSYVRWKLEGDDLVATFLRGDGTKEDAVTNERWQVKDPASEIERLGEYRAGVEIDPQLTESDRQAILKEIDRILEILRRGGTQEELSAALAEPEGALEAMVDPEASQKKELLKKAAEALSKEEFFQVIEVEATLADPVEMETMQLGDFKSMGRRLLKASEKVKGANPVLSNQLAEAAASLDNGDVEGAKDTLSRATPAINELVGPAIDFAQALQGEDYQRATENLQSLSEASLSAAHLAVLPDQMMIAARELKKVSPELAEAFTQASESMEAGNTREAREAIEVAAARMQEIGQSIALADTARRARVARTFWGVDHQNHAVLWEKGTGKDVWVLTAGVGWHAASGGPSEYIPLQKGLLRGDPGLSLRTGRPVADTIFTRLRNTAVLAGIAFVIVMPLALFLGLVAGLNEGKLIDRFLSIGGMTFTVTPEFATGIFLILIFSWWLRLVPGAVVLTEGQAPWERPDMLILPVLTLTLIELGYVLRITRASMVEVMKAPYIRTAFLKGLPYWQIVMKHAVRNALMAPITVIMLHVNWLIGGVVIVEAIFGYPGLGKYLLDSALFKDTNAIEAGAMILVALAVGTQLLADVAYTFLNPRIRYS